MNRFTAFRTLIIYPWLFATGAELGVSAFKRRRLENESCTLLVKITEFTDETHRNSLSCQLEKEILSLNNLPEWLERKLGRGEINSNMDTLSLRGATLDNRGINLSDDVPISIYQFVASQDGTDRRLQSTVPTTGTFDLLVLRTVTQYGMPTRTEEQISDDVFGTNGDVFNMKSQYQACSYGKLNFNPASHESITYPGVKTVKVNTGSSYSSTSVENAAIAAAEEIFEGEWSKQSRFNKYFTMVCAPRGTGGGWVAYAYVNHWLSVYNDEYCSSPSVGMHEVGHNLGLGHSGRQGGNEYSDRSGLMGYSYDFDDGPVMCFNGAKNWQLGWYRDYHVALNAASNYNWSGNLYGISGYKEASVSDAIIIRLKDKNSEYYISYNRKDGINRGTMDARNQVVVHQSYNTVPPRSMLVESISESSSYTTESGITIKFVSAFSSYARIQIGKNLDPDSSCIDKSGKFFLKVVQTNGVEKAKLQTCDWLMKKNDEKRAKICKKKTHYFQKDNGKTFAPPQVWCASACGDTCDPCYENENTYYSHGDGDYRTCGFLKRKPAKVDSICSITESYGGYPIPSVACPITCQVEQCV